MVVVVCFFVVVLIVVGFWVVVVNFGGGGPECKSIFVEPSFGFSNEAGNGGLFWVLGTGGYYRYFMNTYNVGKKALRSFITSNFFFVVSFHS